jgi:hypothetical protein
LEPPLGYGIASIWNWTWGLVPNSFENQNRTQGLGPKLFERIGIGSDFLKIIGSVSDSRVCEIGYLGGLE